MSFTPSQVRRYARHVLLPEIGGSGQLRLLQARVGVSRVNDAAQVALAYLMRAGIGTLVVRDPGTVKEPGFLVEVADVGHLIHRVVAQHAAACNPDVQVLCEGSCDEEITLDSADDPVVALERGALAAQALIERVARGTSSSAAKPTELPKVLA